MLKVAEQRRVSATISLDPQLDRALAALAFERRTTRSGLVRELLRRALVDERHGATRRGKGKPLAR